MPRNTKRTDAPVRIAPMPVLPLFARLAGREVLIVGDGSDGLAWKVALLDAAGAHIRLRARSPAPSLIEAAAGLGERIDTAERDWIAADLDDIAMAIGDFVDDAEAAAFNAACRDRRVPVNVVDRPEYCDFQFGSIVNRAPLMVSISTDGAAPVLAQTVRRKIEALLPGVLSEWTRRAKTLRHSLAVQLPTASARRDFWTRFAEAAFGTHTEDMDAAISDMIAGTPHDTQGRVSLVGAGPGDAELLTLKAVRTLQSADVILFDDLAGADVLELARREAQKIAVGKRGGSRRSCKQDDINALMLRLARAGKHVVRLKAGDPTIFGRAGEEIAQLRAAGIPVEVVPGVTAATAAAARLTTSLTHRDGAPGVKFITAHSRHDRLPDIDWRAAADPRTTLMIYMGAGTAPETSKALIAHGMPPETPVTIATAVSRPEERFVHTTLAGLQDMHIERTHPVLICVGEVFAPAVTAIATCASTEI